MSRKSIVCPVCGTIFRGPTEAAAIVQYEEHTPCQLPPCAEFMGCLCAFHARGGSAEHVCDTSEEQEPLSEPGWEP